MVRMVIRKMLNNPWMMICLLIGSILAVAMVSSIPMYTDGVLQRMLIKDAEDYQVQTGYYPGRYHVKGSFYTNYVPEDRARAFRVFDRNITNEKIPGIELPVISQARLITMDYFSALPEKQREEKPIKRNVRLEGLQDIADHIEIIHGRLFSKEKQDGLYEVIVTEQAMKELDLRLNEVLLLTDMIKRIEEPIKVKVVGVFQNKDTQDPYWFQSLAPYKTSMLLDYDLLYQDFIQTDSTLITGAQWYFAFDYHAMTLDSIPGILEANQQHLDYYKEYRSLEWKFPILPILEDYHKREARLKLTLWMLQVPILLMLAFYLFMVSQLTIENEKNEIAVMKSRGASGLQIFFSYLIESMILSMIALLLGPPLGLFLCNVLGASNGFLEFVQRMALPVSLSVKAYQYSMLAILLFMVTMLIPASSASKTTIVQYKQKKSRIQKQPLWKKLFLDIILLGISIYGLYTYEMYQKFIHFADVEASSISIDPLLFVTSTMFIIGAGLLFLRIYPILISAVFWLGKKRWSPVFYASFIEVGRSGGQNQFLMLFIVVTLSIGIFNANAARTLNTNYEERIRYQNGADIVVQAYWPNNAKPVIDPYQTGMVPNMGQQEPIQYQEPPFGPFKNLKGVQSAAKVFVRDKVSVTLPDARASKVTLMGIIPDEFGRTTWFRNGLLPHHINEYLNLMALDPRAVLLSASFKEKYGVKEGDSIFITWEDQGVFEAIVYAFIDYWPTYNPNKKSQSGEKPDFLVASYSYVRAKMALEPYQVWLSKSPDATSEEIYKDIEDKKIKIVSLKDTDQTIIKMKNDPMVQGTNGVLTLGFIVTMVICMVGFLIYWILSIHRRVLNFGIFRAIGLSRGKVIGMLACEQVLISGLSIVIGIVTGLVSSRLFVPLLQIANNAVDQVPPFQVVTNPADFARIYVIVSMMLAVGISVLGFIISKIKIAQVIKLGED
ncbi:MAG TPA: ABC transporter permease [Clostridiales bacterium]|nr:ABC transporter permease [Clostridiales bacterium]